MLEVAVRKPFKHKGQNIEFSHPLLIFSIWKYNLYLKIFFQNYHKELSIFF